ncbi:NAD-dependent epimerase/dehydratase family protein [Pseudoblastomonas halimionae]|uniref:NAD-dependent epimerase/dehydratase family protein n=1 Tax=Alteriqipengyuania halimionae TaxID=1926630 RepID=A0A6I4U2Z6_9SPHN|nr:NAD-dependent epimerase/dehydratase family protein [Alteriqipengyuania halimionae]MXP09315.1 NAD-dependent epimerase/dehydratase family protein [Alteriqipengyuania halimionae]
MPKTILVTGGTGFIAGEIIDRLLEAGHTVHTTVRNRKKSEDGLRDRFDVGAAKLKIFEADLMDDAGWAEANAGCDAVAHVASPIAVGTPKDEDEMIVPAREGAIRALRFAKEAGVARFVQTSSVAAVSYGSDAKTRTVDESDWTDITHAETGAYAKSKTIAERAARDWVLANGGEMEFVSVNPSMVLGPVYDADFSPSVQVVKQLLDGSMPMAPDIGFGVVDLRDLADLHVRCLTQSGLANERFIASGKPMKLIEIAEVLRRRLPPGQTRKVPKRVMPNWMVHALALFNSGVRQIKPGLGRTTYYDVSHAKEVLDWETRPPEESVVDCAKSLIACGVVKV